MEINVEDLPGSLGGGGRYDRLIGMFLGQEVAACGFSLGLERILVVMGDRGMFPDSVARNCADVLVVLFEAHQAQTLEFAAGLRKHSLRVLVYPDADKLGKQIKYADAQGIPVVAILGSNEIETGTVTIKNLATQTQYTCDQAAAGAAILKGLTQLG